jgi:hypothetical protein
LLHGTWRVAERHLEEISGKVEYVETRFMPYELPEEDKNEVPFRSLWYLSEMVSAEYSRLTSKDGEMTNLSPDADPSQLGVVFPPNFRGKVLKLWIFTMLPKHAK